MLPVRAALTSGRLRKIPPQHEMAIPKQTLEPRPAGPGERELSPLLLHGHRSRGLGRALEAFRAVGEVIVLVAVAATLDLWGLSRNHWANTYYSAAIRSMGKSWHNFLYVAFDPGGLMTVDKPPLALWIESLSARAFGYHPLSILIPEALMGVATVVLLYDLVRRLFGRTAGFIAGIALATTPITVAMSRHNNPDALVALCAVAAVWFLVRATLEDRTAWIVWSGVMVGLAFETKMLVALVVVPGIVLAWLWLRPGGLRRTIDQLVAGGIAMAAIASAWPLLVALTPTADRPWISGTADNSILSLIFGYNGLGRVAGQNGGPPTGATGALAHAPAPPGAASGALNGVFGGATGPFRLLNAALGGQAGWMLGAAVAGLLVIVFATRLRRDDPRSGWVLAVGGAFLAAAILFSSAHGIFHPYYVSLLAPFTAALVGAAAGGLLSGRLGSPVLAAVFLAAGAVSETVILADYPGQLSWVEPVLLVVVGAGALALLGADERRVRVAAIGACLAALALAPSIWAVDTLGYSTQPTFPSGGPAIDNSFVASIASPAGGLPGTGAGPPASGPGAGGPPGRPPAPAAGATPGNAAPPPRQVGPIGAPPSGIAPPGPCRDPSLRAVIDFVKGHGGGPIGVSSQANAADAIICQGYDVVGMGGFSGRETDPSLAWFVDQINSGRIRWIYNEGANNFNAASDKRAGDSALLAAAITTCPQINTTTGDRFPTGAFHLSQLDYARGLFDCNGEGAKLAALGS